MSRRQRPRRRAKVDTQGSLSRLLGFTNYASWNSWGTSLCSYGEACLRLAQWSTDALIRVFSFLVLVEFILASWLIYNVVIPFRAPGYGLQNNRTRLNSDYTKTISSVVLVLENRSIHAYCALDTHGWFSTFTADAAWEADPYLGLVYPDFVELFDVGGNLVDGFEADTGSGDTASLASVHDRSMSSIDGSIEDASIGSVQDHPVQEEASNLRSSSCQEPRSDDLGNNDSTAQCPSCPGKHFRSARERERHQREQHNEDAEKFACPYKGCKRNVRPFTRRENRDRHVRDVHTNSEDRTAVPAQPSPSAVKRAIDEVLSGEEPTLAHDVAGAVVKQGVPHVAPKRRRLGKEPEEMAALHAENERLRQEVQDLKKQLEQLRGRYDERGETIDRLFAL